jgi:hypothetical protein
MAEIARQRWSAERYAETAHFVPTLGAPSSSSSRHPQVSTSSILAAATAY